MAYSADELARCAGVLADRGRNGCGFLFARSATGSRSEVYVARPGVAKWMTLDDCSAELKRNTGYGRALIEEALWSMSLPRLKFAQQQTLAQKAAALIGM